MACIAGLVFAAVCLSGCASPKSQPGWGPRPFEFERDTFAYANELVWEYQFDPDTGRTTTRRREPPPSYTHHCFVVARAARQFFDHARFDPALAKEDAESYRSLIQQVMRRSPRSASAPGSEIVIPGYAHLREFSEEHEELLKAEAGGAWQSYFQRGHWRIMFPFTRRHQAGMAEQLAGEIDRMQPPVIHLVRFPRLSINHAMLLFDYRREPGGIEFLAYDPNAPEAPVSLWHDAATRRFYLPRNDYFIGGRADVYQIYHSLIY